MASAIQMPKLSDTMTEGVIQKWLVKEGDKVSAGDPLAEVETDKATLEMEAYESGTILKILADPGKPAQVGAPIAVIGKPGEDWQAAAGPRPQAPSPSPSAPSPAPPEAPPPPAPAARAPAATARMAVPDAAEGAQPMRGPASYAARSTPGEIPGVTYGFGHTLAPRVPPAPRVNGEKVRASPLARKVAADLSVDLSAVQGTGPGGRITRDDVEQARPAPGARAPAAAPPAETVPMSMMRKAIARNLVEVKRNVPHFYLTIDVDMGQAVALRAQARAAEVALSVNDLLLKAVAVAAMKVPRAQGQLVDENTIRVPREVNLGMAVALDDGLVTPVIRRADALSVGEISRQAKELAARARDRKLEPEDYAGGTITVSNLGMYEIEHFYAILSPGQASIVSAGKVREEAVVQDGQIAVGHRLHLGYAGDHRVVDGAVGAQFLKALKAVLENPVQLLLG